MYALRISVTQCQSTVPTEAALKGEANVNVLRNNTSDFYFGTKPFSLTFGSQNCNSLNLTGISTNLELKVAAITKIKKDIIFLSDIRLLGNGAPNEYRVSQAFKDAKSRSYKCIFNSSGNSRGVAIAIGNDLPADIIQIKCDTDENYLLLKIKIFNKDLIVGAVYGPNGTDRQFFVRLKRDLETLSGTVNTPIILGGDWNTTWDTSNLVNNIDTFQMSAVPNITNGRFLQEMCTELDISDPYRTLYPNKRDFTYQPFGNIRLNRSRIDFFCISNSISGYVMDCSIGSSVLCNLFDHKTIYLKFGVASAEKQPEKLSNRFLEDPIFSICIKTTAVRTHLFNLDMAGNNIVNIAEEKRKVQQIRHLTRQFFKNELNRARECASFNDPTGTAERREIELLTDLLADLNILENLPTMLNKSEFFTLLTSEIRKSGLWAQKNLFLIAKEKLKSMESKLSILKDEFEANFHEIFDLEKKIQKLRNNE